MGNNGNNKTCNLFGDEKVKYPVNYDLKVIMDANQPDETNMEKIREILEQLKIPYANWRNINSRQGNYVSFTVNITVISGSILNDLYRKLKKIPEIKYAI